MTAEQLFCRAAEGAMTRENVRPKGLADLMDCGVVTVKHLLACEPVRMTQAQVVKLFAAAGMTIQTGGT